MNNKPYFIIDFDSTFVSVESLDELAKIVLRKNPEKVKKLAKIKKITREGTEGTILFSEALKWRMELFSANKKHLALLLLMLKKKITPSILRNKQFFQTNKDHIYIISGGFKEYIYPIVKPFGIAEDHVLANTFVYDDKENIIGFDNNNPNAKDKNGKAVIVKSLNLPEPVYFLGDGMSDYTIKEAGMAEKFFAFTENSAREVVIKKADKVVKNFDEFLFELNMPRTQSYPKTKMKVLLLENIHPTAIEAFTNEGYEVEVLKKALPEAELKKKLTDVSILGVRSKTEISREVLSQTHKLLAIGAFCIGTNQIDLAACSEKGIAVFNAPFSNTRSVAEMITGEIIMLSRKIFERSIALHRGQWDKSANNCHEIRGRKLGIIGYGNIGSQVSVLAEALGMDVYFYNTSDKLAFGNAKKCGSMEELLKIADIVTIHVSGKISNRNLIGEKEFTRMKNGVLFLNASRGFVVNLEALTKFIKNGKIAGAAIDVYPKEPEKNGDVFVSILQNLPNVILTPHLGSGTEEGQKNIGEFVSDKLIQFVNNGNTTLSVNFPQLQLPKLINVHRFIHIHKNIPGILAEINSILSGHNVNIEDQYLQTNTEIGYVITDVNKDYDEKVIEALKKIPQTIKFRVLY